MRLRAGAMFSAQVLSTVFGIASGPGALLGFRSLRSLATPASDIRIWEIGVVWEDGIWMGRESGGVKTDLNCCSSISVLERASLFSMPLSRRGDTPIYCLSF